MSRRFKREWREAAATYIGRCWTVPKWRYLDARYATQEQLIEAAMAQYRSQLEYEYSKALKHPRSKKAIEAIYKTARSLASIAGYHIERQTLLIAPSDLKD